MEKTTIQYKMYKVVGLILARTTFAIVPKWAKKSSWLEQKQAKWKIREVRKSTHHC